VYNRRVRRLGRPVGLAFAIVTASGLLLPAQQPAAVEPVLAALDRYFSVYRDALGKLVAEERMVQQTGGRQLVAPNSAVQPIARTREIVSDVAFVDLPGNAGWLGYRDTKTVGGKAVPRSGPSLVEALMAGGASGPDQARALLLASARHNLGAPRTTNLPSLPLELLQQRNRARFRTTLEHRDRVAGHDAAVVLFEETATPTLIQRPEGGDVFATVRAWIEPGNGRLWRAHVRLLDARVKAANNFRRYPATVEVWFEEEVNLGLLVPSRMDEEFYAENHGAGRSEARYRKYRRFSTTAKILPPGP
jgi:hypothetical protein